jgi:hypothetical protein
MKQNESSVRQTKPYELAASFGRATGWRVHLWAGLLVIACTAFSLGFACAAPLAAVGASATLTASRRDALYLTGAAWLVNQFVGYSLLGYPWTLQSFAWGGAIGAACMLATIVAYEALLRLKAAAPILLGLASLMTAFAIYEIVLFAVANVLLGGSENFTFEIIAQIFAINGLAFICFCGLYRVLESVSCGSALRTFSVSGNRS